MWHFDRRPRGQTNTEYALILLLVAAIIVLALLVLSGGLGRSYQKVVDAFNAPPNELTREVTSEPQPTDEATQSVTPEVTANPIAPTADTGTTDTGTTDGGSQGAPSTPVPADSGNSDVRSYFDQFDGRGNIPWLNRSGTWAAKNQYFTSSDSYSQVTASIPFDSYDFSADVQTVQSMGSNNWDVTMVLFRVQDANTYYAVMLKKDSVVELASNRGGQWHGWLSVTSTRLSAFDNHTFRIKAFGNHIQVFIDGRKYVDYRDSDPISSGGIGFTNNNSIGRVDNVTVDKRQG